MDPQVTLKRTPNIKETTTEKTKTSILPAETDGDETIRTTRKTTKDTSPTLHTDPKIEHHDSGPEHRNEINDKAIPDSVEVIKKHGAVAKRVITIFNVVCTDEHNSKETRKLFNGITCVTPDGMAPRILTTAKGTIFHTLSRIKFTITVRYVHGDAHKNIET